MPVTGQGLADLLSGAGGAPVDRPALNNFVATSQARNGLVSAQTQDAMLKASQAQEEQAARARLKDNYVKSGLKESDAQLAADISIGGFGNAEVALKALGQTKLGTGTPADQVSGQQMYEGKVAPPVGVPNTYIMPPGSGLSNAPILQTNQGAALTSRQQSLTGVDVARAEELHAKAKNDLTAGTSTLSPAALHEAALVTMADPSKMSTWLWSHWHREPKCDQ